jgi:hypothetical protein
MILNNAPQNEAILSNVGQIGEFRIRNSAKAFNILSSGLYANKIRAIVRELSCNAVDSHVAAGKPDLPFDVHLPNTLEPWFSIRDYGTGLTHEQVTNIYTTYFESTKTDSNDFIGALGLGSKSPFSYTDNFTVTAVKDGRKGIYTAFINEHGVPSIALMSESETKDPNGVEVKFSVNDRWDFDKFHKEALVVYKYFKLRPVIHGCKSFAFIDPNYQDRDIIPGVHSVGDRNPSVAIMGNIAYPIDVPQTDTTLGDLRHLLSCGLVMEFDIGELDFQASREGLSYIPSTIQSIKRKLEALNNQLVIHVSNEADKIQNFWQRADYLSKRHSEQLFKAATVKYVSDTKFPLADPASYNLIKPFMLKVTDLQQKYNITIRGFNKERSSDKCNNLKTDTMLDPVTKQYVNAWRINPHMNVHFVITDTKRGALERAKHHWRNRKMDNYNESVIVIEPFDKTKTMSVGSFLRDLHSPLNTMYATQLLEKNGVRSGNYTKASILQLEVREKSRRRDTVVWVNSGTLDDYDDNKTYYYIQMNHWTPVGVPYSDLYIWYNDMRMSGVYNDEIYGVRKNDIEAVKNKPNWIELNGHVKNVLKKTDMNNVMGLVKESIDYKSFFKYVNSKLNTDSPYYKMYAEFKDVQDGESYKRQYLTTLMGKYDVQVGKTDPTKLIEQYKEKVVQLKKRYPLISNLNYYSVNNDDVVDYINMIDTTKGI